MTSLAQECALYRDAYRDFLGLRCASLRAVSLALSSCLVAGRLMQIFAPSRRLLFNQHWLQLVPPFLPLLRHLPSEP